MNAAVHPSLARALVRWQHAAGPYWPFVCAAPFLAEYAPAPLARMQPPDKRLVRILFDHSGSDTATLVDLPPSVSLATAPSLNRAGRLVVPVIQRWNVPSALLPSQPLARRLMAVSGSLAAPDSATGVVFYLDGDRHQRVRAAATSRTPARAFDNRYVQSLNVLPPSDFLAEQGITDVVWITHGQVAKDVQLYRRGLGIAGLELRHLRID